MTAVGELGGRSCAHRLLYTRRTALCVRCSFFVEMTPVELAEDNPRGEVRVRVDHVHSRRLAEGAAQA